MFTVCIDTGGTFTDCVVRTADGALREFKAPSTPEDFSIGVMDALREAALAFGRDPAQLIGELDLVIHATTAATNALVTRNVARTALVTTQGFRDIIEIRRSLKIETQSMYNAYLPPYDPVVPRRLRFGIAERTNSKGEIVIPVQDAELRELAATLQSEQIEAVSVAFINSYANPENEQKAAAALRQLLGPDVFVTTSCELLPKLGEYERISSSVISACLGPIVRTYLDRLRDRLTRSGFRGALLIMQANQFAQSVEAVMQKPAYLMGSGPAAAPAGAAYLGDKIEAPNFITADMGGTTLDISLVTEGRVGLANGQWLGDDRLGLKVVDVVSVAAGGGSIGWIDSLGLLKVGPQSAGANPGPACFGRGGARPTVTDAALILGFIPDDFFWEGKLRLDLAAARAAVAPIAEHLGLTIEETSRAMLEVVSAHMADRTAEVTTKQGHDVRDYVLLAIGGAGPLCGAYLASRLGMDSVMVPRFAASFSAWSMFSLDIGRDYLRAYPIPLDVADQTHIRALYEEMVAEALRDLAPLGARRDAIRFELSVDLRYQGQYHEMEVPLAVGPDGPADVQTVSAEFARRHRAAYSFDLPGVPLLLRSVRLVARLPRPKPGLTPAAGPAQGVLAPKRHRRVYSDSGFVDTPIYDLDGCTAGLALSGPCVIEGPTTTVVVPADFMVRSDAFGNLLLTKRDQA